MVNKIGGIAMDIESGNNEPASVSVFLGSTKRRRCWENAKNPEL
jgi:hypothetical protein